MSAAANTFGTPNNTVGTLNGFFKETYADKLEELIPDGVKLLNKIKFMAKDKQPGNLYHQPVILGMEHGITFAQSDDDAFNLAAPIAGVIKDAQVRGNPAVMRSLLGYVAASRAALGGTRAFMDATKFLVANMLRSMAKKLEIEMLYGQVGYATVASGGGTAVLTITTSQWAPGIWAGSENMPIEIRSADGSVSRGTTSVQTVNMSTYQVTTISAIPGVIAGDVIWHGGAYGNEFPGIHQILTQTTGTLFNISLSNYNLFVGNQYDCQSGALSFTKLNQATARAIEKGLEGVLLALINVRAWANLLSDQAALRKYDESYSTAQLQNGSKSIKFFSQNGEIEIEPSIYVKEGYAYLLSLEDWFRVGSTDMTFKRPGQGEEFFRDLENAAAYELRLYTDQAVFCMAPGRNVILINVVNLV
jgi:hypothetical protein